MIAQLATGLVGIWLVISAFLWRHSSFQRENAIVSGLLAMALAIGGACVREAASLGAVLAMWLYLSSMLPPTLYAPTARNNILAAVVIWVASLAAGLRRPAEQ